ncbi:DNA phosphorothioation system sulfurtransferase DndC [Weeksellaceae bacterium TAE3-ERU29]|nr:DNA phosphorothioation system sulfurtransferase DndC [Weeksellaceae bacterium TAE3-ERU29]
MEIRSKKVESIIEELMDQYAFSDKNKERPWIIGFSGGKDSTVLLTLVWIALERLKEKSIELIRPVYVVCNDTMVENPIIEEYVSDVLSHIKRASKEKELPVYVKKTTPKLEENFWINVIGRGYPVPNNTFRWCTDRLKIKPTSDFLLTQIDEMGEAIVLLGTRYEESVTRANSIKKHEVKGKRLSKHNTSPNTYVYAPIKSMLIEEIWYIINAVPSPWGFDNSILFKIYADASADDYECPTVVTNKNHTSCGQSRFGCWTCTVVKKDKSMSALVANGQEWMTPMMVMRDELVEGRNLSKNRMETRRNGQRAVTDDGHNQGNYTPKYRSEILERLLRIQLEIQETKPHVTLISNQELIAIQVIWHRDMIFDYSVHDIYQKVYHKELSTKNISMLSITEKDVLTEICEENLDYYRLIDDLLTLQESKSLMISKYGIHNDIEKRIEKFVVPE